MKASTAHKLKEEGYEVQYSWDQLNWYELNNNRAHYRLKPQEEKQEGEFLFSMKEAIELLEEGVKVEHRIAPESVWLTTSLTGHFKHHWQYRIKPSEVKE